MTSVMHALRVLDLLDDGCTLRVVDVALGLGLSNSTAHRLLKTLREAGYLHQQPGSRQYEPGPAVLRLARRLSLEARLERVSKPHLRRLCDRLNETINVQVLTGKDVFFVASEEDQHRLRVARRVGTRGPAHASAGGKVMLAGLSDDEVRGRLGESLRSVSPSTVVSIDTLLKQLRDTRRRGYGLNAGETDEGVRAVAVPITDPGGKPFAALSLAAPEARLPDARIAEVLPDLRATATAIAEAYWGTGTGGGPGAANGARVRW